jgi:hypothetical protein
MTMAKKDEAATDAERSAEAAQVAEEAEASELDETVPGGRYEVGGVNVNAEGEPLEEGKGKK